MLTPRGKGTTLLLGRLDLLRRSGSGIGAFSDTIPGDDAQGLARKRPLARDRPADWPGDWPSDWPSDWPGLKVAIALRGGLRAIPLTGLRRPPTAGASAHG